LAPGKPSFFSLFAKESVWHLERQTGPVPCHSTHAATMFHVAQGQHGFFHQFVACFTFASRDAANSAGIAADFVGI
jgi:hypothetical protein